MPPDAWGTAPLYLNVGGKTYYYQNDHLGTPQKLMTSSGAVVWSAEFEAFGLAHVGVNAVENPLRFPGQYFDLETGTHYNFFRDYDPSIGRYVQSDPIGLDGGVNTFGYVGGNPLYWIDPYGLYCIFEPIRLDYHPTGNSISQFRGRTVTYTCTGTLEPDLITPEPDMVKKGLRNILRKFPGTIGVDTECYSQGHEDYKHTFEYEAKVQGMHSCYDDVTHELTAPRAWYSMCPSEAGIDGVEDIIWNPTLPEPIIFREIGIGR